MSKGIFIEGVKRSGKSKYAIDLIHGYLRRGRKVATNLDLFLDKMEDIQDAKVIRLPDHPTSQHLTDLGVGYPELEESDLNYDENKNGVVVIDELLTHLNSRSFKDKDRLAIVSWFVQMGKYGWDLVLIGQDFEGVDKQLRDTTIDQLVNVKSGANYFGFGFINAVVHRIFDALHVPKFSVARFYDGKSKTRKAHGYQFYIKSWTHPWYNTAQKFLPDNEMNHKTGALVDMRASYSLVPPKQLRQFIETNKDAYYKSLTPVNKTANTTDSKTDTDRKKPLLAKWQISCLGILAVYFGYSYLTEPSAQEPGEKPQHKTTISSAGTHKSDSQITIKKPDVIKGVYITCTVSTAKSKQYCFEKNGVPFHPSDIDIGVVSVSTCRAQLYVNSKPFDVYCNPHSVDSWSAAKPEGQHSTELTESDLVAAN